MLSVELKLDVEGGRPVVREKYVARNATQVILH